MNAEQGKQHSSGASNGTWFTQVTPAKSLLTPFPFQQCVPLLQPGCSRKALKSVVLIPQQLQYFILERTGDLSRDCPQEKEREPQ